VTDELLLARIVSGDVDAFGQWLAGAEPRVRGSLASFAAVVDVEAVLQEALLRVWQVAPRFVPDGRPDGLVRFAVRIARNLAVSELRRTRTRPVEPRDLETEIEVDTPAPDPMLRQAIVECRDKLPAKPRQALDARLEAHGASDDTELAEGLGMKLNTFLQNFTRARQLLAECLGKRGITIEVVR
jgi:RNA polymerase sigma factor (sigma-70 family)